MANSDSVEANPSAKSETNSSTNGPNTKPAIFAPVIDFPELVFGLVGPIGVDLDYIGQSVEDALKSFGYALEQIRLTEIMKEVKSNVAIDSSTVVANYNSKIDYANDLRRRFRAKDLLAALAMGAIKRVRPQKEASGKPRAFLVRQIKTPEEVRLFRRVYSIRDAAMFVTTFPCHLCAKHIVASGIRKVIYLEPYPKSYARHLHNDSIQVEARSDANKVVFQPFIGISPYRYRELFEKTRRKNSRGEAQKWQSEPRKPIFDFVVPAHLDAEAAVVAQLAQLVSTEQS